MRIAIIGGGVSGLTAAHLLHPHHDVVVFESRGRIGGHVNTVEVESQGGERQTVDTGFIVYNEENYPLFTELLEQIGVATQPSNMSFGVRSDLTGVEYSSATLNTLFAQRRNVVRPAFHRMLRDILRFNREARRDLNVGTTSRTLGDYLEEAEYSDELAADYLIPMGSALWSIPGGSVLDMPADFFVRFFENHGMLKVRQQPEWRVVTGGSARYVEALTAPFRSSIRTSATVRSVSRHPGHVSVDGEHFDEVIFACHADTALAILDDPSELEREILGALPFQSNEVVLHTDTSVLPKRRRAWASWNYHIRADPSAPATVTYNMNRLQSLESRETYCVSLNATESIRPASILYRTHFDHPVYTVEGMRAQNRRFHISGHRRTHFCGAYWGFGFHEDGVRSAVEVADRFTRDRVRREQLEAQRREAGLDEDFYGTARFEAAF